MSQTPHDFSDIAPVSLLHFENSKITAASIAYLAESVNEFTSDEARMRLATSSAKTYPSGQRLCIPPRNGLPVPRQSLDEVLSRRRSVRKLQDKAIPFLTLASLLEHAAGVTGTVEFPDWPGCRLQVRANPSGGGLFPVEIYVAVLRSGDIVPGIYHYQPIQRAMESVRSGLNDDELRPLLLTQPGECSGSAYIILSGKWSITLTKYGERGYRILWLDAGHVAQNLLLVATALDLHACSIAGFHDDRLAQLLGLDPREEPVLHVIAMSA